VKAFFDTNILVYAATSDAKKRQAVDCLGHGGTISIQVLNEFVHVAHIGANRFKRHPAALKPPVPPPVVIPPPPTDTRH